jgi:hypothetical protein
VLPIIRSGALILLGPSHCSGYNRQDFHGSKHRRDQFFQAAQVDERPLRRRQNRAGWLAPAPCALSIRETFQSGFAFAQLLLYQRHRRYRVPWRQHDAMGRPRLRRSRSHGGPRHIEWLWVDVSVDSLREHFPKRTRVYIRRCQSRFVGVRAGARDVIVLLGDIRLGGCPPRSQQQGIALFRLFQSAFIGVYRPSQK